MAQSLQDADEEPPRKQDWESSPYPLNGVLVRLAPEQHAKPGVKLLGPPLGEVDLITALEPLYVAGSNAAIELAFSESGDRLARETVAARGRPMEPVVSESASSSSPVPVAEEATMDLSERLVDILATIDCASTPDLSDQLGVTVVQIRSELLLLERLGIVYRTGQTRATRWWLG
jgi:hypothetical protein